MKIISSTALLQVFVFLLMITLWIYFISYSYRRNFAAPWGFSILILEIVMSGYGLPIFKDHFVVFFLDLVFVISLIAVILDINSIQNQIITGSLLNILQFTGIGIIAGLMLVIIFIVLDIPNSFEIPPQYTWIAFFSIGVQAAITEELLFRGYFLSDLIRYGFNITFALIFQAMVFAILHLSVYPDNLLAIFVVFLVGLISG